MAEAKTYIVPPTVGDLNEIHEMWAHIETFDERVKLIAIPTMAGLDVATQSNQPPERMPVVTDTTFDPKGFTSLWGAKIRWTDNDQVVLISDERRVVQSTWKRKLTEAENIASVKDMIRTYHAKATAAGWCQQCRTPWEPGICTCFDHTSKQDHVIEVIAGMWRGLDEKAHREAVELHCDLEGNPFPNWDSIDTGDAATEPPILDAGEEELVALWPDDPPEGEDTEIDEADLDPMDRWAAKTLEWHQNGEVGPRPEMEPK